MESKVTEKLTYQDKAAYIPSEGGTVSLKPNFQVAKGERLGGFNMQGLYRFFFDFADAASQNTSNKANVLKDFNAKLGDLKKNDIDDRKNPYPHFFFEGQPLTGDWYQDLFFTVNEKEDFRSFTERFMAAKNKFYDTVLGCDNVNFSIEAAKEYLNAYLDLCSVLFNSGCIYQDEVCSMQIAEKILNIGLFDPIQDKKNTTNSKANTPKPLYEGLCTTKPQNETPEKKSDKESLWFGIMSPFTVFSLVKAYYAALQYKKETYPVSSDPEELDRRKHIFATNAIHSFSRFTTYDHRTYLVDYSRRNDIIICRDMNYISSIENVKPIRLLEKITSYISNYYNEIDKIEKKDVPYEISVGIFGFCSVKIDDRNTNEYSVYEMPEVDDLVYEVLSWCEDHDRLQRGEESIKLHITYYIVSKQTDVSAAIRNHDPKLHRIYLYKSKSQSKESGEEITISCPVTIQEAPVSQYNKQKLKQTIKKNNLLFFLDCPWLTTENYSILNEGSFETYGKWISSVSLDDAFEGSSMDGPNPKTDLFSSVNDQLNRLATNNAAMYGKIVRVFKDYILDWMGSQIKQYQKNGIYKTIYIYSSSIRGVSLSEYASVPVIREESYSNKKYSILRFSTRRNLLMRLLGHNQTSTITIPFWNFIKYFDVSFAYLGLQKYIVQQFMPLIKEVLLENPQSTESLERKEFIEDNIISLLRNFIFIVTPENSNGVTRKIQIMIALDDPLLCRCELDTCRSSEAIKQAVDKAESLVNYFEQIITNVVFKNTNNYGDAAIRDAFASCLYNQGNTVDDVYFYYEYNKKRKEGQLENYYKIEMLSFVESINRRKIRQKLLSTKAPQFRFDKYSDKRLYKKLLEQMEEYMYSPIAINTTLDSAEKAGEYYINQTLSPVTSDDHVRRALRNIEEVCKKNKAQNTQLYRNVKKVSRMRQ